MTSPTHARETDSGRIYIYDGPEIVPPPIHKCGILHVRPDSCELVEYPADLEDLKAFWACRNLWDWHHREPLEPNSYVSVTNAIGMMNKPALIPGARKVQAEEILGRLGFYVDSMVEHGMDKTRLFASRKAKQVWDEKTGLGSAVHASIERWIKDPGFDVWDEPHDDVRSHLEQFVKWWDERKPTLRYSEVTGFNKQFRYAGTIDLIVDLDEPFSTDTVLLDIKSGAALWPEFGLQLAAYRSFTFYGES
jgi:hypothetical protein